MPVVTGPTNTNVNGSCCDVSFQLVIAILSPRFNKGININLLGDPTATVYCAIVLTDIKICAPSAGGVLNTTCRPGVLLPS